VSSERDLRGRGAMNTGLGRDGKLGECFVSMLLGATIGPLHNSPHESMVAFEMSRWIVRAAEFSMGSRAGEYSKLLEGNSGATCSSSTAGKSIYQSCRYQSGTRCLHSQRPCRALCHNVSTPRIVITTPNAMLVITSGETEL